MLATIVKSNTHRPRLRWPLSPKSKQWRVEVQVDTELLLDLGQTEIYNHIADPNPKTECACLAIGARAWAVRLTRHAATSLCPSAANISLTTYPPPCSCDFLHSHAPRNAAT